MKKTPVLKPEFFAFLSPARSNIFFLKLRIKYFHLHTNSTKYFL